MTFLYILGSVKFDIYLFLKRPVFLPTCVACSEINYEMKRSLYKFGHSIYILYIQSTYYWYVYVWLHSSLKISLWANKQIFSSVQNSKQHFSMERLFKNVDFYTQFVLMLVQYRAVGWFINLNWGNQSGLIYYLQ